LLSFLKFKGTVDVSSFKYLPNSFIEKYKKHLNWAVISRYQKISDSFIKKYIYLIQWRHLSKNETLSEELIEKYIHRFSWSTLLLNQKLSKEFLIKHIDIVQYYLNFLLRNKKIKLTNKFRIKYNLFREEDIIELTEREYIKFVCGKGN